MKKLSTLLLTACLFCTVISTPLMAGNTPVTPLTTTVPSPEASVLLNRLNEINTLDKSTLTAADKKALRKETRSIKHELKRVNGGVYLSAGAIIIIVVLLILLL